MRYWRVITAHTKPGLNFITSGFSLPFFPFFKYSVLKCFPSHQWPERNSCFKSNLPSSLYGPWGSRRWLVPAEGPRFGVVWSSEKYMLLLQPVHPESPATSWPRNTVLPYSYKTSIPIQSAFHHFPFPKVKITNCFFFFLINWSISSTKKKKHGSPAGGDERISDQGRLGK